MNRNLILLLVTLAMVGVILAVTTFMLQRKSGEANLQQNFIVGGVYSIEDGTGKYGVAKVLVVEPDAVHVRVYKNKFDVRPSEVDTATLTLGSVLTDKEFGIGHLPLAKEGFVNWRPVLVLRTPVTEEELEGYRIWKDGGGVWEP
jgi:hypothetical protein